MAGTLQRSFDLLVHNVARVHRIGSLGVVVVAATIVCAAPAKSAAQSPNVITDKASYVSGEPIVATFSNGPGNPTDWLGIYPQGITPDGNPPSTDWYYVNGSKNAGAGLANGQVTFNTVLGDGNWTMWFLANDGYTALDSTPFTVASGGAGVIRIGPYLQNATSNGIVIMWETSSGDESRVDFGLSQALGTTVFGSAITGSGSSRIHTAQLTGLQQDTYYHYRVTTGSVSSAIAHFKTMPTSTEADSRFVVYSDMQEQGAAPTNLHGRVVAESMSHHIPLWTGRSDMSEALDFVLVPGDLVDSGPTYSDWETQFFDEAQPLIQYVPYFTALGNHEQNHMNYYNFMNNPLNGSGTGSEQWYTFDHGSIKIITLNSNNSATSQLTWLDARLAEACIDPDVDFVFAQFHHAHISETWLDGQNAAAANFATRLIDFTKNCGKASVHFYGHNHSYQRGQVRDHSHFYMDVSSAEGDLAYWGVYNQANSAVIQKAIVEWGWSFVEAKGGADPSFTMRRIGLGGENEDYVVNFPGVQIDALTYRPGSAPPSAPSAVSPTGGAQVSSTNVVLSASGFIAQEPGASHAESHFQVTTVAGNYGSPVKEQWFRSEDRYFKVNLNAGVDLTRTKDLFNLGNNTTYYWRVRYRDSGFKWSNWSAEATFTTGAGGGGCLPRNAACSASSQCCSGTCRSTGRCR